MKTSSFISLIIAVIMISCEGKNEHSTTLSQPEITTYAQIDSVYNSFQKISFSELPERYREVTGLDNSYGKAYASREFLIIRRNELDRNLVADVSVSAFLPEYNPLCPPSFSCGRNTFFLLVSKKLLYIILDLKKALEKNG